MRITADLLLPMMMMMTMMMIMIMMAMRMMTIAVCSTMAAYKIFLRTTMANDDDGLESDSADDGSD